MRREQSVRRVINALLLSLATATCGPALSQTYPSKPVHLIVPFPPGAYTDTVARLLAAKLRLGQPVVVENRAGAGGNIGAAVVAKAAPDGYTLLMGTIASAISVSAYARLPYDLTRDLVPVSLVATLPFVLVSHPGLPVGSLEELIQMARDKPGSLNYASSGNGSALHLAAELFKARTQADLVHVPYKGIAPAVRDLLAGRVSVMFPALDSALPHIRSSKLKPFAVTTAKRSSLLPNVPTMIESGFDSFEIVAWGGVLAPAGTPKDIISRLEAEIGKVLSMLEVRNRLSQLGAEAAPSTSEEFRLFIRREIEKWAQAVKTANVRIE